MAIRTTELASSSGSFASLRTALDAATRRQEEIQSQLKTLDAAGVAPRLPMVGEMMEYVLDVERRITEEPTTAREALRRVLIDGKIVAHRRGGRLVARRVGADRRSPCRLKNPKAPERRAVRGFW